MFKTFSRSDYLDCFFLDTTLSIRQSPCLPGFNPQRILVIKLDHLGDVLLATPVFSNLRCAYPSAKIHVLAGEWGEVGLRSHPDVDKILRYNARFFCRPGKPKPRYEVFTVLSQLRQQKYDLIIDLRGDWLTALFALMKPTRYRLDYAWLQVANKLRLARFTGLHQLERNLDLLRTADIPISCELPAFHTDAADRNWVDNFLHESEISPLLLGRKPSVYIESSTHYNPSRFSDSPQTMADRAFRSYSGLAD